jgi:polyhydroxyalkanoate synthesis regulator phasin
LTLDNMNTINGNTIRTATTPTTNTTRHINNKRMSQQTSETIMRRFFKGELTKEQARVLLEDIWKLNRNQRSTTPDSGMTPRS